MATVKDVMIVVVKLTWKFAYFCDTTFWDNRIVTNNIIPGHIRSPRTSHNFWNTYIATQTHIKKDFALFIWQFFPCKITH